MGIKKFHPVTPGLRFTTGLTFAELDDKKAERSLTKGKSSKAGRGAGGRISVRRRGGGHKRKLRTIDFLRGKTGVEGKVAALEYDPNRTANIALIVYRDGDKRYILAPKGLKKGDKIISGPGVPPSLGNCLPLEEIPLGTAIHNIELVKGKGGQLARSAGAGAVVAAKEGDYVTLKLPSGEMRMVFRKCVATIGVVGNDEYMNKTLGKAGRSRWLGKRPSVRGEAMNPVDHPLGGRTKGGRHPVSPTGVPAKGFKTRKKRKQSNAFIVKRRK
ncbi:MAG: 50S ribosomal protein L2 [Spirochaetaceae bacterium]|nr:50S ribosomal protein L2 [Spirochaetaceae bacterium]